MKLKQRPWLLRGGVLAIALLVALGVWLATRDEGTDSHAMAARIVTPKQLSALATESGHPLYWAGQIPGTRLEASEGENGDLTVRYLSGDAKAGSRPGDFLAVGTYPLTDPSAALDNLAASPGATVVNAPNGTKVVSTAKAPLSAYFANPAKSLQVEVYAPRPKVALGLALSGRIRPVPGG